MSKKVETLDKLLEKMEVSDSDAPNFTEEQIASLNEQLLAHDMKELLKNGSIEFPNGDVMMITVFNRNRGIRGFFKKIKKYFGAEI